MKKNIHQKYLQAMGIQLWEEKNISHAPINYSAWENLQNEVAQCTLCELSKTRTQVVFGVGNKQADLLIVGEAPGEFEDLKGEPFVGRAGMLLNSMLNAIGLKREDIYIANVLKCRPPKNRDPLPHEVSLCTQYLKKQIALLQPKLIVAVGRIAAHFLLGTEETMKNLRGKIYPYGENKTPLLITYHPAYLLRSPREKKKAYIDLLKIDEMVKRIED